MHQTNQAGYGLQPDEGLEIGFGGMRGANRGYDDRSRIETLPAAFPANYGKAPGLNPAYGSKGLGEGTKDQVTKKR